MLVSCLMPTYNRLDSERFGKCAYLVDEAVHSFLQQTYPHKELIIVNDCAGQVYEFNHPQVRIVNIDQRARSLGEKMNFIASLARGEILARWDDDDISLPWRLEDQVRRLTTGGDHPADLPQLAGHDFVKSAKYFYSERGVITAATWANHTVAAFRAELFHLVGGYPHVTEYEDHMMDARLAEHGRASVYELPLSRLWYIYRWADHTEHLSGYSSYGQSKDDSWHRMGHNNRALPGRHTIQPHWRKDYVAAVQEFAAKTQ